MRMELNGVQFDLLHEKALWKEDERLLVIADVHLGKVSHFRKHGISIPARSQHREAPLRSEGSTER